MRYPLDSRLLTSSEPILSTAEQLSFDIKDQIEWNNTLRNTYITKGDGRPTTYGHNMTVGEEEYQFVEYNGKRIPIDFDYILSKNITIPSMAAGECISSCLHEGRIHAIFKSGKVYQYAQCDEDGSNPIVEYLDCTSAMISCVYDPEQIGLSPVLWTNKQEELTYSSYTNHIVGCLLDNSLTIEYDTDDYIPLGDIHSATVVIHNKRPYYIVGFDDIDHNRSRTLIFSFPANGNMITQEYKWFGCVSPMGVITGEPIPDPTKFTATRNQNGTYSWDMYKSGTTTTAKGSLIGGYTPPILPNQTRWDEIIIDTWEEGECLRVNISANDEKIDGDDIDPAQFFVSNFADSRSIYYDYGQGWLRTYVRKTNVAQRKISDMYIYTYGAKKTGTQAYRKESLMAKGKTAVWSYTKGTLSQRVYTIGGNNKGDSSILALQPFTVELLPTNGNELSLTMEIYALRPLSWSFKKSLITPGADHSEVYQVHTSGTTVRLCVDGKIYEVRQSNSIADLTITKIADYMFLLNIMDAPNLLVEDTNGNIELERTAIPYNMECILDIEDKNLEEVPSSAIASNNTFYWAAGYNMAFTSTLSTGRSSSYLMPAIGIPIYVSASQLSQLITEVIDNRGPMVLPLLRGLFDDYEEVDIFYTIQSNSTTISYMTSNIVKTTEITTDRYDLYGKATFEIDKSGWVWNITLSTVYYPVPIGCDVQGYNYITPTLQLPQDYAARLYVPAGMTPYAGYIFAQAVYLGNNIFTIYGSNYFYNKQAIYFTGQSNYNTQAQFVCYVLGMKYLANSGSEAYFYSDWERKIYIFTGSQTLQPADSLSSMGDIIDALYSSKEQILYLLTDDNRLIMRSSTDTAAIDNIPSGSHLEGTDRGCAVVWKGGYMILSPRAGESYLPFRLKTSYYGDDSRLLKCPKYDIQFYRISDKPVEVRISIDTITGIERKEQKETILINPADWKSRNLRHSISLRNNVGNAFAITIESDDEIAISYLNINTSTISDNQASKRL